MQIEKFYYTVDKGWSIEVFPEMDSENTLIIIFSAPEYIDHPAPIEEIKKHYPKSKMIGCSSAGTIKGTNILDKILVVAIIRFENTSIKIIKQEVPTFDDSFMSGKEISEQLTNNNLRGIFVLSEGLKINGSELVKGLYSGTNKNVVITGGLAGDNYDFKRTWVIYQGKIYSKYIVAVGLYGTHIKIGSASGGGWDIFGPERHITRSKNNILYELNEKPALELYKKLLGDRAADLPASGLLFPLAIRKDENDKKLIVRTILAINEEEQSLIFAGDMPNNYLAQLMRGNFDRIIASASEAAETAMKAIPVLQNNSTVPVFSIAISCVGRRLLLGERTEEEIEAVLDSLPTNSTITGFYSYGEISPYSDGMCDLHNQTMTLTIWYET